MKTKSLTLISFAGVVLALPAAADVIYSNLQDISIPATFAGVYLNVETGAWNTDALAPQAGWDINPFFGGSVLWNSPTFQPVRSGTTETSTVLNLTTGTVVNGSSVFSTFVQEAGGIDPGGPGYGISETHMSGQFTSGSEGYLGFRLNGSNYGYMRVVFDSSGAGTIKEWAYDDTGAAITTGNIVRSGANVNLDSSSGAFNVSSVITDSAGTTNVVKTGSGTASLSAVNTYTGATLINTGRLNINGSLNAASAVTVASAGTLGGDGVINGNVTLDGVLRPGQGGTTDRTLTLGGSLTANAGSSMAFTISSENSHDQLIIGSVNLSNTNLSIDSFTDSSVTELAIGDGANFLTNGASFYKLIDGTTSGTMFANAEVMPAWELSYYGLSGTEYIINTPTQRFWLAQGSIYAVAIPESSTALFSLFGAAVVTLRRRRK